MKKIATFLVKVFKNYKEDVIDIIVESLIDRIVNRELFLEFSLYYVKHVSFKLYL